MRPIVSILAWLAFAAAASSAAESPPPAAVAPPAGTLEIIQPWIQAPPKEATDVLSVTGYAGFRNDSANAVRIVRARSKQFRWVMIQRATLHDGQGRRTVVGDFTILPGTTVAMSDAGYRFAFLGPRKPVTAGRKIEVELEFRDLPPARLVFPVLAEAPAAAPAR